MFILVSCTCSSTVTVVTVLLSALRQIAFSIFGQMTYICCVPSTGHWQTPMHSVSHSSFILPFSCTFLNQIFYFLPVVFNNCFVQSPNRLHVSNQRGLELNNAFCDDHFIFLSDTLACFCWDASWTGLSHSVPTFCWTHDASTYLASDHYLPR